ncbi:hypothetical protein C8034_v001994 [Colletotrichum sidae]|uniref:Uncharacterized protein n=1 Tax=Colletotrichum sidae TaxID=1347389 RepID=A0A4R8TD28_9PEZI|nr:hypothetical protein C8034_v001994 [Colletotrichum sidae]
MLENGDQQSRDTPTADRSSPLPRPPRKVADRVTQQREAAEPADSGGLSPHWPFSRVAAKAWPRSGEIESLRRENQRLSRLAAKQEADVENLQKALDEADEIIKSHKYKHAEAQQAHDKHFRGCQREIHMLQEQLYNKEVERYPGQVLANSRKVSDTAILEVWKRMAYNICSIANTLLTYCPAQEELEAGQSQNVDTALQITPAEYELLSEESTKSAVSEYYIWRSIYDGVFGSEKKERLGAWGGVMGTRFHLLCCALFSNVEIDTAADFFLWRSKGATLVEAATGFHDRKLQQYVAREQHQLSALLPLEKRKDKSVRNRLHRDLLNIFEDALRLYSVFMTSRAFCKVYWPSPLKEPDGSFVYDPTIMEAEAWGSHLDRPQRVVFNISPGLLKNGTADGSDYDRVSLLVKPRVVCS